MNKFKLLSSSLDQQPQRRGDGSQDQKQHRREEIHLLNILDRCTRKFRDYSEILRDDRIWIRNRVKEMDPDILAIFRKTKKVGSGARMNESELHQLQVNLRKHVNRVKEKHKQEQLVRFKQNMCSTNCLCEKNNRPTTISNKTNHTERIWQDESQHREDELYRHSYGPYHQESSSSNQGQLDSNTFNSLFKNKKKNLFDALKLNEPIEEESEKDTEKMSSYRSRSEEPQNRINYHFEEGVRESKHQLQRHEFNQNSTDKKQPSSHNSESPERHDTWLHNSSNGKPEGLTPPKSQELFKGNNWSMYNVSNQQPYDHSVHYDHSKNGLSYEYSGKISDQKGESQPSAGNQKGLTSGYGIGSVLSGLYVPLGAPKEQPKQTGYSESTYHPAPLPAFPQHYRSFENNYVYGSSTTSVEPISSIGSSQKPSEYSRLPQYKPFEFSSFTTVTAPVSSVGLSGAKSNYSVSSNSVAKPTSDNENLFTSPELLMECRKILQQSGQKKTSSIIESSFSPMAPLNFSVPSTNYNGALTSQLNQSGGINSTHVTQLTYPTNTSTYTSSYGLGALHNPTSNYSYQPLEATCLTSSLEANKVPQGQYTLKPLDSSPFKGAQKVSSSNDTKQQQEPTLFPGVNKGFGKLLENVNAKDCFSEVKEINQRPRIPEEKVNPLANLMIVDSFEKESPGASRPSISGNSPSRQIDHVPLHILKELSPEDVFDAFFFDEDRERTSQNQLDYSMSFSEFSRIASRHFRDIEKLEEIFESCDKLENGTINCLDFGKALDKYLQQNPKLHPNPIRQIFSLIDIKQKGYFTLEDYQRFLEQVLESEQQNYESVARFAYRLFEMADLNSNKQVEYWGLYFTKETEEFQSFSEYLEQFEFEVEI